jgi:hypothetical protein
MSLLWLIPAAYLILWAIDLSPMIRKTLEQGNIRSALLIILFTQILVMTGLWITVRWV